MADTTNTESIDYLSLLPDDLIQSHIFPKLSTKEAARTCILSSRWKSLWASSPYLDLYQFHFRHPLSFRNFVDQTLRDHAGNNTDIHRFNLFTTHRIPFSDINNWVRLVMSRNVKEFQLKIFGRRPYQWPSRNVCMANTITLLELHNVRFSTNHNTITLPHLKTLSLESVNDDEETIENFINACPSMSDLEIWNCYQLNSLTVAQNPQLKRVRIGNCIMSQNFGITHVPCLESLTLSLNKSFQTLSRRGFVLDSRAYGTLKELHLWNYSNEECDAFQDLLSALTNLECLVLQTVIQSSKFIEISNKNLKSLLLDRCDFLMLSITAPNLTSLKYENNHTLLYTMDTCNIKDYIFLNWRNYSTGSYFKSLKFKPVKQFLMNSSNDLSEGTKMIIDLKWCNYTIILEDSESIAKLPCEVIDALFPKIICFSNMSISKMVEWFMSHRIFHSQKLLIISSADESKFYKVLNEKKPDSYYEFPSFTMNREAFETNTGFSVDSLNNMNGEDEDKIEFLNALFEVGSNTKHIRITI